MTPQTIIAAVTAVALFALGFHGGQAWRQRDVDRAQGELAQAQAAHAQAVADAQAMYLASMEASRHKEQTWQAAIHQAEQDHAKLKRQIDSSHTAASTAARRLRDLTASHTRAASLPTDTCTPIERHDHAATAALGECGEQLATLAGNADRCEIERRTLIEGWPK